MQAPDLLNKLLLRYDCLIKMRTLSSCAFCQPPKKSTLICWIVTYLLDETICSLNNWGAKTGEIDKEGGGKRIL